MKGLSIEQKAQRYDEALEKSKRLYEQGTITESLCYVFPELKDSGNEKKQEDSDFIDIPFGAFDSELYHQEIYIPDGFEATIKDNKVILKRKENEDERIRKELCKAIWTYVPTEEGQEYIAWLEKQKVLTAEEDLQGKEDVLWCIKQAKKYAKDENEMGTCWFAEKWLEKQGKSYTKKDVDNAFIEGMAFAKDELEKQSEQKLQGKSALEAVKEEKVDNTHTIEPKDYHNIDPHFGILID